jgi:drug/metabolite transporter (DMT)-like permease
VTVLGAIACGLREHMPTWRVARRLIVLGLLGNGLYQVAWIEGLARINAGTAALIFAATPAFIGIVGRALGVEHPTRKAWIGIGLQLVGMSGVVLGSAAEAARSAARGSLLGLVLILAAAMAWAFYSTLLKKHAQRVHPVQLSAWTLFGGALVYAVVGLPGLIRLDAGAVPTVAWAAVLGSGTGALVVAYLFYYRGMRVIGPVKTAMFSNLQPIVALVVAYFVLHEVPTPLQLGGATLIMSGLLVSRA